MSGFVGILHSDGAPVDPALLRRMTDFMSYCGPDHQDVWLDGRIGLGHALLRMDMHGEGGAQPCSLGGQVWIAADARLDGQAELIGELRGAGREVATETQDAELVLHAYAAWGEGCVERLIGDYAFAVWDAPRQRLFCARDQFGVVPFYYARLANGLVFGNVLKCLRLHPAVSDGLNDQAIGDFLLFGVNMDTATTTFADIQSLPPGHTMTWADATPRIRRYWELTHEPEMVHSKRPQDHVERFAAAFDLAVGDRLRASAVGTHLSGGMDSTSITATARKLLTSRSTAFDLRAYTIVFDRLFEEEEGLYADQVAAAIDVPLEHLVEEDYLMRRAQEWVWSYPEPGNMPELSAHYEILRRVASFARALLVGFGGDPLLEGPTLWTLATADRRRRDAMRSLWSAVRVDRRLPPLGVRAAWRARRPPAHSALPDWIAPDFARRADLEGRRREVLTGPEAIHMGSLRSPFWVHAFAAAHPGAGGVPLKPLFPFFDLRLVQCVMETPPAPWRYGKRLLREAMQGTLPESVRQRPKTVLFAPSGDRDTNDPGYRLAGRPEVKRWRHDLISVPGLGRWIATERVRGLIDSPIPSTTRPRFEISFHLAHWLRSEIHADPPRLGRAGAPTRA